LRPQEFVPPDPGFWNKQRKYTRYSSPQSRGINPGFYRKVEEVEEVGNKNFFNLFDFFDFAVKKSDKFSYFFDFEPLVRFDFAVNLPEFFDFAVKKLQSN
jgi:hypothetical protein